MNDRAQSATGLQYSSFDRIPVEQLSPLITRQFAHGAQGMLARLVLRKGTIAPRHSHHSEHITYVLAGALCFTFDDRRIITVSAGETLVIPSYMPHAAEALEDTINVDIFAPPREDWIDGSDSYLRK